jgi:hypothetical protein
MRHSLDQIGGRVHAPAGHTVELLNFNRGQSIRPSKRNSMRHSLDQIGDRVHAPAGDTVYKDQIGDKVHAAPGDTVELLSFNRGQSTRPSKRNSMRRSLDHRRQSTCSSRRHSLHRSNRRQSKDTGDTVELLSFSRTQSTRHTMRTEDTPKEDMFQKSDP